jgi:hypothetical protein
MNFPSFGDAAAYDQVGAACASALTSPEGSVFTACYHPLRPIGIAVWSAIPHLLSTDPVDVAYITLTLNVLLLSAVYLALMRVFQLDPALAPGAGPFSRATLAAVVFVSALLNLVPHLPVTLADLPSLAAFLPASVLAARILLDPAPAPATRRYLWMGVIVSVAALLRQHYLAFGLFLLAVTLWLDRGRQPGWRERFRCAAAFGVGLLPVLLQVAVVYAHSGELWLYETARVAGNFDRPHKELIVESLFFSIPPESGFMVKLTEPRSFATVIALRLYKGLCQFQWAVYQGNIAPSREWWTPTLFDIARAWTFVAAWAGLSLATFLRGPVSLRLLGATAFLSALAVPWFGVGHTELRYFLFPRIVLWVTVAYWLSRGLRGWLRPPNPRPGSKNGVW